MLQQAIFDSQLRQAETDVYVNQSPLPIHLYSAVVLAPVLPPRRDYTIVLDFADELVRRGIVVNSGVFRVGGRV